MTNVGFKMMTSLLQPKDKEKHWHNLARNNLLQALVKPPLSMTFQTLSDNLSQ